MDWTRRTAPGLASLTVVSLLIAACGAGASPSPTAAPTATPTPTAAPSPTAGQMQVMATGKLEDIDGTASGTAKLVVEADGSYALVLENFAIDSDAHTNVLLVAEVVHMSDEVDASAALDLGPLKGTSGLQSYPIPADMAAAVMDGYHAVVIWDTEMTHAIAAAELS